MKRKYSIGAELFPEGVHFRVWAPKSQKIELIIGQEAVGMEKEEGGYFSLFSTNAKKGSLYHFRIDGGAQLLPDPASRYQPEGPSGPSCVVDPGAYLWKDQQWKGAPDPSQIILYEFHVGTFTPEGTWKAAQEKLKELVDLGVTVLEMMPIADFPGKFGWGYDGVNLFAPTHIYGTPEELREFVDHAHNLGLAVILDVVYNHFGPSGNFIEKFSEVFFSEEFTTDWGKAIHYSSPEVREFFITNAKYWIEEFHFDGLRLDATQNIYDYTKPHIIAEISRQVREVSGKNLYLVAENECQEAKLVRPSKEGGYGLEGIWNDDFHHTAMVSLLGRKEAYYTDYNGTPQEILSALKYGFLYQGQYYAWQEQDRGAPALDIPYKKIVHFLLNHDQVANAFSSHRVSELCDPNLWNLFTTLLLLSPQVPLLFQGQEFGATAPFPFFADHEKGMHRAIWAGRKEFLAQFPSFQELQVNYQDPCSEATFLTAKLSWEEKAKNPKVYALHKDLLALRKKNPVFTQPLKIDGALITADLLLIRYFDMQCNDHLLFLNFGIDHRFESIPEPLFAPPEGKKWRPLFSSQNPAYGGGGMGPWQEVGGTIPGRSALVLTPIPLRHAHET